MACRCSSFLVLGAYFSWFWSHGGQTVAMTTWHIRLLMKDGQPVPAARAALRYVLSWLWFLPALAWAYLTGARSGGAVALAVTIGVLGYAMLSRLNPQRQYWHDLLCGTRLVQCQARRRGRHCPAQRMGHRLESRRSRQRRTMRWSGTAIGTIMRSTRLRHPPRSRY